MEAHGLNDCLESSKRWEWGIMTLLAERQMDAKLAKQQLLVHSYSASKWSDKDSDLGCLHSPMNALSCDLATGATKRCKSQTLLLGYCKFYTTGKQFLIISSLTYSLPLKKAMV